MKRLCGKRGAVVCVAVAIGLFPAAAQANTPITSYSALPSTTQAGGHPDLEVQFGLSNRYGQAQGSQNPCQCEDAKDATVHLPPGFIGNPHATPQCTIAEFSADSCPIDSQVGIVNVLTTNSCPACPFNAALYNLVPPPDVAGLLGFKIFLFDTPQFTVLSARTGGDYGLDATAISIFHGEYPLETFREDLWGVPADPSHDYLRLNTDLTKGVPWYIGGFCDANGAESTIDPNTVQRMCGNLPPVPSNSPRTPFQYGTTAAYGSSVPCSPGTPYTGTTAVSADLSGLTAETTYHYRVVLTTANGIKRASDRTFKLEAVYSLSTGSPSNPEPGSVTLSGSFTGDGNDTHYYFEYVDYSHYDPTAPDPYSAGQTTAPPPGADAGSGTGTQDVSALANLSSPYIVYHYRLVATNSFGTSYGSDRTLLSSPPALPTIDATSASNVTPVSVTLDAQVNPGFGPTLVRFEYGTTTSYGSRTYPTDSIGDDNADHPASIDVSGLTPATTYHFRALATNFSGIVIGPDQIVTTPDLPAVEKSAATDVTQTTATLGASVRPGFRATTYHFEYGPTDSYGSSTPESASVGADNSAHPASAPISALTAATTYHYRVVATNAIGTTTGPDQAFTTAPVGAPSPPPPLTCKRGFVKRHGKCVKVRHRNGKHNRRAHR